MANEAAYLGTELKYAVTITASGFSMLDDDFKAVVSCGNKKKEYAKSDFIYDGDGHWYLLIDTSEFRKGDMFITTYAYVPDEDCPDGIRTEVDYQKLAMVKPVA